ncbi:MAG: hypothetical protein RL095_4173 [Verrucomicrobiota bacterium]|jgi:mono/diheme cytochrome c family protein
MMKTFLLSLTLALSAAAAESQPPEPAPGREIYAQFCANCHGPRGEGGLGPNLTDKVFLHGGTKEDIAKVIRDGIPAKNMPAWGAILKPEQIAQVSDFVHSRIGLNLKTPEAPKAALSVNHLPKGTIEKPLLLRSFVAAYDLDPEVLAHHGVAERSPEYDPKTGKETPSKLYPLLKGLPTGNAVSFGDRLSYVFDGTECRLLYAWSGGFLNMKDYWGPEAGGGRKDFNYLPRMEGKLFFMTSGKEPLVIQGEEAATPKFRGYRKVAGAPEFFYDLGKARVNLLIRPGPEERSLVCAYRIDGAPQGLSFTFDDKLRPAISCDKGSWRGNVLTLNATEGAAFTLTFKANR